MKRVLHISRDLVERHVRLNADERHHRAQSNVVNAEMRKGAVMQKMSIVIETAWAQGKGNGVSTSFLHTAFV
jgi:hypothetical protein